MKNINFIKRTFVRQSTLNDCGTACLAMIFNYAGKSVEVPLMLNISIGPEGLSLIDLREISANYNLNARCVKMDMDYLRRLQSPCILHMTTELGEKHFQVCYGSVRKCNRLEYLMGDPSKQIYFLEETALGLQWESKSALFFEDLRSNVFSFNKTIWSILWSFKSYPTVILFAMPTLSLFIGFLGLALTWMLQKGISEDAILKGHISLYLLFLLFFINIFKSILSFLRQHIMVHISTGLNEHLFKLLIDKLFHKNSCDDLTLNDMKIKNGLFDIFKIQSAMSNIIAIVLSDGVLLIMMTLSIFFYSSLAGVFNACYITVVTFLILKFLPIRSYDITHLNSLAGATEKFILKDVECLRELNLSNLLDERKALHLHNQNLNLSQGISSTFRMNKMMLWIETLGTLNVLSIFALALYNLKHSELSTTSLMITVILSYLTSTIMPKICNSLSVVAEGADAAVQFTALIRMAD